MSTTTNTPLADEIHRLVQLCAGDPITQAEQRVRSDIRTAVDFLSQAAIGQRTRAERAERKVKRLRELLTAARDRTDGPLLADIMAELGQL